ncbi:MAG: Co2+/Mg2+ efflux protein ApaG [Proteobacteria bacterium]|nr:Co2+/Mg2+ efflux protein ApaG [Pseudomonadota bacterium]
MQDPHKINVSVKTGYVRGQSDPDNARYVFAYTITITNSGSVPAKLLRRRWLITDANGKVQEVRGDGVVGKQPRLEPGDTFCYTSAAVIETPFGYMQGSYYLIADDGIEFDTEIPVFRLSVPHTLH